MPVPRHTRADRLLAIAQAALRLALPGQPQQAAPDAPLADAPLPAPERRRAGALMRVNHAGEVAAQGLYLGQALTARDESVRAQLDSAAAQEAAHLEWCRSRLRALHARRSLLDPLWFAGSVAIGALAGLRGDRASLGFVAETERQVEAHLHGHLQRLPEADLRSRAIVEAMRRDEARHGARALAGGGIPPRFPVPTLMRLAARIMTRTAYWL
jgi:3-demethoxyubiquinol 3-hydroxylase